MRRIAVFLVSNLILLSGCVVAQAPQYSDPPIEVSRPVTVAKFGHVTLGVVLTDNTRKAIAYLEANQKAQKLGSGGMFTVSRTTLEDSEPHFVTDGINRILSQQFRRVVMLQKREQASARGAQAVMLLDVRIKIGSVAGEMTNVSISGVFMDSRKQQIATVRAGASKRVVSRSALQLKAATSEALALFAERLDSDNRLVAALNGYQTSPYAASERATPVPARAAHAFGPSRGFGRYHAIVIGNNSYTAFPRLTTAVNDARAIAQVLRERYGFDVQLLINATRADILRALNAKRGTLTERDNLLLYYAGHGWLDEDAARGYWLPVDADRRDPTNWLSNASITDAIRAVQAKHVLVVADSCYSGSLTRGISASIRTPDFFSRIASKKARTVMSSGGIEPVLDGGGEGGHSIFADALLTALRGNSELLDATTLFSQIRRPVMVNSDQTPEYGDIRKAGHNGGDFVFVPSTRIKPTP